jgi:hypothetical protein
MALLKKYPLLSRTWIFRQALSGPAVWLMACGSYTGHGGGAGPIREWEMADDERQQKRREAGLKSAATKGKEGMRAATLKGLANRTPEQLSASAKKAAQTRARNRAAKGQTAGS